MNWGFSWLLDFVNSFTQILYDTCVWCMDGIIYAFKQAVFFILDGVLTMVAGLISVIDVSALTTNMAMSWGLLPPAMGYMLLAIAIPQGLAIIGTAMIIRMGLNLIPAALTRI